MSLIQTSAPARAIWIAIARPTPPPEPVTSAVRPAMKFDQSRITSDLHDDRDDRGPAAGALADELPERAAGVAADRLEVGGAVRRGLGQRLTDCVLRVLEQRLGLGRVHPTLGDDLRTGHDLAGALVDGDDHDDHALLGQLATVAQHAEADVADDAVDVEVARGDAAGLDLEPTVLDRDDVAVLAHEDVLRVD